MVRLEPRFFVALALLGLATVRVAFGMRSTAAWARGGLRRANLGWPAWMRDPLAGVSPEVCETVRARLVQYRVYSHHATASIASAVFVIPALLVSGRIITGGVAYMTVQQEVGLSLCFFWVLVLSKVSPSVVNERTYLHSYVFFMAAATMFSNPVVDGDREMVMYFALASQGLCIVVGFTSTLFVAIPCNLAHDIIQVYAFAIADPGESGVSVRGFAEQILYAFLAKTTVLYAVDRLLVTSLLGEAQAKQEKGLRVAVVSLLNKMCDAVVELDEKHCIMQHEPRLAQVLLHGGASSRSLEGAMLQDFVPQEKEKEELTQRLSTPPSSAHDVAGMFHITVKDAMSSPLRMQCYHVAYESFLGVSHHIIGLLEDSDAKIVEPMQPLGEISDAIQERLARKMKRERGEGENSMFSSSLASLPADHDRDLLQQSISLQAHITESRLVVVWASDLFLSKFGATFEGRRDFLEWLPVDGQDFFQKVSKRASEISADLAEPGVVDLGEVLVVPIAPHLAQRRCKERPRPIVVVFPAYGAGDLEEGRSPEQKYTITILIGSRKKLCGPSAGSLGNISTEDDAV